MSGEAQDLRSRAAALREAFDRTFAAPPPRTDHALEDVLAVRIGGDPFALRLSEVADLRADRVVVPVPSAVPELLGLVGLRGTLAPVYDLAALLGYPPHAAARWLVVTKGAAPVALAFEAFETHARVPREAFVGDDAPSPQRHVRGAVRLDGALRPILATTSVLEAIASRAGTGARSKEP